MDGSGTILKMTSFKFKTVCPTIVEQTNRRRREGGGEPAVLIVCRERVINQRAFKTHTFITLTINKIPSEVKEAPRFTMLTW